MLLLLASGALCASNPQILDYPTRQSLRAQISNRAQQAIAHLNGRDATRSEANLEFRLQHIDVDLTGEWNSRFEQFHKGVRVWGHEVICHQSRSDQFKADTGQALKGINLSVQPTLPRTELLSIAREEMKLRGNFSQDPELELVVVPITERLESRFLTAEGETPNALEFQTTVKEYALAYRVYAETENEQDGLTAREILVDAHDGKILKSWDALQTAGPDQRSVRGTGKTKNHGEVSLDTTQLDSGKFDLRDTSRPDPTIKHPKSGLAGNAITSMNGLQTATLGTLYSDDDNLWGDGQNYQGGSGYDTANGQTAAADVAYEIQVTWDYLKNILGRNGIDNKGTPVVARVHYGTKYENAAWSAAYFWMVFGDYIYKAPDGTEQTVSLVAQDITAHELGHGVNGTSAKLIYADESGGLNEANSDIHGTMAEFYLRGAQGAGNVLPDQGGNWTVGEDLPGGDPIRYMIKPSKDGRSPDAWTPALGTIDVHYSSGPMNRAFYFLSQGSSAVETDESYSKYMPKGMKGIGNDKAIRIWYKAVSAYMTPSANYADARSACLRAAKDIYPNDPDVLNAVVNAFAAINVGVSADQITDFDAPVVSGSVNGTTGVITFVPTIQDASKIKRVEYWISRFTYATPWRYASTLGENGNFELKVNSQDFISDGSRYILTIKAFDEAGNVGTSQEIQFYPKNETQQFLSNGTFEGGSAFWKGTAAYINSAGETVTQAMPPTAYSTLNSQSGEFLASLCQFKLAALHILQPSDHQPSLVTLSPTAEDISFSFDVAVSSMRPDVLAAPADELRVVINDNTTPSKPIELVKFNVDLKAARVPMKVEDPTKPMNAREFYVPQSITLPASAKGKKITYTITALQRTKDWTRFMIDNLRLVQAEKLRPLGCNPDHVSTGDALDMALLASAYSGDATKPGFVEAADFNQDGRVDESDVRIFLEKQAQRSKRTSK